MLGGVFGPEPRKYATWLLVSTRRSRNIPRMSVEPLGSARLFPPIEASRYPRWPESVLRECAAGANSGYWSAPLATFGPLSREAWGDGRLTRGLVFQWMPLVGISGRKWRPMERADER